MSSDSVVEAVELAYRPAESDARWLGRIIEQLAPSLDVGMGVFGWFYDASDLWDIKLFHPTLLATPPGSLEALYATLTHTARLPGLLAEHYGTPAGTVSSQLRRHYDTYVPLLDHLAPMGIRDIATINGFDLDGHGLAINVFHPHKLTMSPTQLEEFQRLAAHLITAHRLRRQEPQSEAILGLDGKIHDATGRAVAVRDDLGVAARVLAHARGKLRKTDPFEALETWRALVDGRWSLVDFEDSDGKRFLVARVNEPKAKTHAQLSAKESLVAQLVGRGHPNKLIGYELGVSEPRVTAYINAIVSKLELQSRADVVRLFAAKETPHETSGPQTTS